MKKKYTIEEFKEYFEKVEIETIDELQKTIDEELDAEKSSVSLILGLQNIVAIQHLKKNLFK